MRSITHRELRNSSAEILRAVEGGESFVVTNRGAVVANLVPPQQRAGLPVAKPATRRYAPGQLSRVELDESTQKIIDDLRDER